MRRRFGSIAVALFATGAACAASDSNLDDLLTTAGRQAWTLKDLGPQVRLSTVMSTAVDPGDQDTSATAYFSLMGEPGKLVSVNFETGQVLKTLDVPESQGTYGMIIASDKNLYLSSHSKGFLYRHKPGSNEVEKLGHPGDDVSFIWDVVEGEPGKLYGCCYPGSMVFEYDISAAAFRSLGSAKEGEDYARGIAWDDSAKKLYVGIGSHADIIELDPVTGDRRSVMPQEYKDSVFMFSIGVAQGQVITRVDPGSAALIIDPKSGETLTKMPAFTGSKISPPGPDGAVYFSGNGNLQKYDPATRLGVDTGYALKGEARGFAWKAGADGKPEKLLIATTGKNVHTYDPLKQQGERRFCELPQLPLHIQNIIAGADGQIYSSGYVSGNLSIFDPATGEQKQYSGVKQAEGVTFYGDKLFLGTYPGANLSVYETIKPQGPDNPRTILSLKEHGQDRPFGMLGVPEERKVFMGTVPGYGLLGGALAVYDPETSSVDVHRNLIKDQGIVTFAYKDGVLFGGTTVYGGLGIEPTAAEAKLFLWDVKKKTLTKELVPVKGKRGISGLRFDETGNLWGWAEGALFIYNPEKGEVTFAEDKLFSAEESRHFWRGGAMTEALNGKFYGVHYGKILEVNTTTKEVQVLAEGEFEIITSDPKGNLYAIRKENLVQLAPR